MKRISLSVLAVFLAWSIMDFVIHGVILSASYADTPSLWRPMAEMKMSVTHLSVVISALAFVLIYSLLISKKGISTGLQYGLLFGLATGVSMGFGSYSVMPIPLHMAVTWFLGSITEAAVGGIIVGWMLRTEKEG
jgi:hypothetical protein